ncbi:hypothetical protein LTR36_010864 [Oleoguttula mirabilis]|uniref:Uncharacterized protein n=1 Tax=Oleoguttula mirabilis TaxID=1507867 RepID=A0AAV9J4H0_9PEZI|nr:hypothetical protein LTR36_010864 [Oleoguttula mirabilis]
MSGSPGGGVPQRARKEAQELVDEILGKRVREPVVGAAGKLAAEIFGKRRKKENTEARRRQRARLAARTHDNPQSRCRNWMLHEGNVHYARNGSAFRNGGYTKLDLRTRTRLGVKDYGAIGIGTVDIVCQRGVGGPDPCVVTMHDVLHVPSAPCSGISIAKLRDADVEAMLGRGGCVMVQKHTTEQMFAGTRVGRLFRVSLFGESAGESPPEQLRFERPFAISLMANEDDVMRFGRAAREIQGVEHVIGAVCGKNHGVSC